MARQPSTQSRPSQAPQNGRAAAPPLPAGPRVRPAQTAPQGQRLAANLGPGLLNPGVGKRVQRSGEPERCGTITGQVYGYTEHPNSKNPARVSTRFAGPCLIVDHAGKVSVGTECYLPATVERALKAALKLRGDGPGDPVAYSIEVWCEPDADGRPPSPLGYSYVTYDRMDRRADPVMALAYASGILEPPQAALADQREAAPDEGEVIDPETGEVRPAEADAA